MSNYMRHIIKNRSFCRDLLVVDGGFDRIYHSCREIIDGRYVFEKSIEYQKQMMYYSHNGRYDLDIPSSDEDSDAESTGIL